MKKNIAIIAGGDTSEYEVSLKSAANLLDMMDKDKYSIYTILVRGNEWNGINGDINGLPIDKNDFSLITPNGKLTFDFAYITIHGTPGEDGRLQAYFEMIGIPYSSPGVFASSITYNKLGSKLFLKNYDVPVAKTVLLRKGETADIEKIIKEVGLPCFVKPNEAGSSFGVSKVKKADELNNALEKAFREDDEALIEEFIEGTEVTCGTFKINSKQIVLPVTEIVSETEFFDYEAKYLGKSKEITPARLSEQQTHDCQELTSKIYSILNLKGIVRIDYIFSKNKFYYLEVNTTPGMSPASIIPQQLRAAGMNTKDVFSSIIEDKSHQKH